MTRQGFAAPELKPPGRVGLAPGPYLPTTEPEGKVENFCLISLKFFKEKRIITGGKIKNRLLK